MIDSHFHLEEKLVDADTLVQCMDDAGIGLTFLIGTLCPPLELTRMANYLLPVFRSAIHRRGGLLKRAADFLYRNGVKDDGTVDLLGRRYPVIAQPDNDSVHAALEKHPDRFRGYVFVNPRGPVEPAGEVERCVAKGGFIGVKAHPFWHDYPIDQLADVASLCQEKNIPMLIHLGTGVNGDFRFLHQNFSRLRVIYAHTGIPYSVEVCELARKHPGVYVDFASADYVGVKQMQAAVRTAGVDKCIFGTDGPYMYAVDGRFPYGHFVERVRSLNLSDRDFEKVTDRNIRRFMEL